MATTIEYEELPTVSFPSTVYLNALFTQIATVLNGKLDVRGDTVEGTINGVGIKIINVPEPTEPGDLLRE